MRHIERRRNGAAPRRHPASHRRHRRGARIPVGGGQLTGENEASRCAAPVAAGYGTAALLLHWLVAGLAAGVVALGWAMAAAPVNTPRRDSLLLWHRSLGLLILAAMLLRLFWRRRHRPPRLPPSVPPLVAALARATHRALDAILIAMPIAGYLSAAAAGHWVSLFGLVPLPPLMPERLRLSQAAIAVHLAGQYLFYFFALLHIAGALYHAILRGDGVFERMLPPRPAALRAAVAITRVRRRAR